MGKGILIAVLTKRDPVSLQTVVHFILTPTDREDLAVLTFTGQQQSQNQQPLCYSESA